MVTAISGQAPSIESLSWPLRQRGAALLPCSEGIAGGKIQRSGAAVPGLRAAAARRTGVDV